MRIKACALDRNYTSYKEVKDRNVIAQGWSNSYDLSFLRDESDKEKYIRLIKSDASDFSSKKNAFEELFNIRSGDIILAFEGANIAGICEVPKNYAYVYQYGYEYPNSIFPVKWVDWDAISKEHPPTGYRPRFPIFQIQKQEIWDYVKKNWYDYKKKHDLQIQPIECSDELQRILSEMPDRIKESKKYYMNLLNKKYKMENIEKYLPILEHKKQIILQGAPGTGKTYAATDMAEMIINGSISASKEEQSKRLNESNQYKLIQFHPAYTYEDFVRGIIAKPAGEGVLYEVENKTLAKFANDALENYQEHKMDSGELAKKKWLDEKFEDFVKHLTKEMTSSTDNSIKLTDGRSILKIDDNRFIYGNYEYLNFSEIKKLFLYNIKEQSEVLEKDDIQRHVFYRWYYYYPILEKFKIFIGNEQPPAQKKVELKNFVLIIDEINRANLPAVLGELIYALEYRNQSVESMYEKDGDNRITLPENLYIIGTMNTADRSVGNIDYAIRRRFAFVDMLPKKEVIKEVISDEKLRKEAERIFDAVAELFHGKTDENGKKTVYLAPDFKASDVQIGHSYFLAKDEDELKLKLEYEIKPILREYVKDGVLIESAKDEIEKL